MRKRDALIDGLLLALATAVADRNYADMEVLAARLVKHHGMKIPSTR